MTRNKLLPVLICVSALGIAACDRKGPAERAGEKVDHTVDTIKR